MNLRLVLVAACYGAVVAAGASVARAQEAQPQAEAEPQSPEAQPEPQAAGPPAAQLQIAPPGDVAGELDEPPAGRRARKWPPPRWRRAEAPAVTEPWSGPRVEVGYLHYVLSDSYGGGDVNAGSFGGYLPTGVLRLGALADFGVRTYQLGPDDAALRASALIGYQHLRKLAPLVPYAAVVGTVGLVLGKRFHTPFSSFVFGMGIEVGADLNLARSLFVGLAIGYARAGMEGLGYHLWTIRLSAGL